MGEIDLYGKRLDAKSAQRLKVDSERMFATTFLAWFGNTIPLIFQPGPIHVDGLGTTCPDFDTPLGYRNRLIYEVTETINPLDDDRKVSQYNIRDANRRNNPGKYHLEVNGNTLLCPDYMMETLEQVYSYRMKVYEAQRSFRRLGQDHRFFMSVMARAMV
jgi:hypothetical protein